MGKLFLALVLAIVGCTKKPTNEVWIYTSLYKDTIADIQPKLRQDFPEISVQFFQAGSEDVAAKVNGELLAGGTKADLLITSDRFWYEEMAAAGKLHPLNNEFTAKIDGSLRHPQGFYNTLSIPVMVLAYNSQVYDESTAPKTFKEMTDSRFNGKFTTGSPLSSGTNFTTVAFLQLKYGWDYFQQLGANNTMSEGGNSAVLRRIQSQERPVGWVLLENVLRFQDKDKRLKTVFPADGVVIHNNVLAITTKPGDRTAAEKIAHWFFTKAGQEAMIRSYMYSPFTEYPPPKGAPAFSEIKDKALPWTPEFVQSVMQSREQIKEKFTEVMFN